MASRTPAVLSEQSTLYLKLAREIATDLYDIETILNANQITAEQWEKIKNDPTFQRILGAEVAAWNSAINTLERTKLKAGVMIEEWLPEAYARMSDSRENLTAKTELAKLVTRIAGMGLNDAHVVGGTGERITISINLGADAKFEKTVSPKIIDHEPTSEN